MESIHVRQTLRPKRFAFVVNEGDLNSALLAVSLNTVLWGGIYNPVVPHTPKEECLGLLKSFDPDNLVDLTGGGLDGDLQELYQGRIVPRNRLVDRDDRAGKTYLHLGFDITPILQHIYEKEIRFTEGHSRAVLFVINAANGWPEYGAFMFGDFSRLPETDVDYRGNFETALRPQVPLFDPEGVPENLLDLISPIRVSQYGLRTLGRTANLSSHIIYIGDHTNVSDLIEFWNIRATGRTVLFVPSASYKAFEPLIRIVAEQGCYPINPHVQNEADLQKGPSIPEALFNEICEWVGSLDLGRLNRGPRRPRFGLSHEYYVGDIHAADIEAQSGEEISLLQDSSMTPVKLISPEYLDRESTRRGDYSWSVEIRMTGGQWQNEFMFDIPDVRGLERKLRRNILGSDDVRIGRRGVVLDIKDVRQNVYLFPVRTEQVFYDLFNDFGFDAEPSEPGRYAEQIIKKMGLLHFDCRIFKVRGVRDILDRLSSGLILTKGNMYQLVMSTDPDEYGQNWRPELYEDIILRSDQRDKVNFTDIFNELLGKKVIRPGFTLRCGNCFGEDWYHVSEFAEEFKCRFCFTQQQVNFGSIHEWQYKADGLFKLPDSARGSLGVILSLWRLGHVASMSAGRYLTSTKLREKGGERREYEIDYAYLSVRMLRTSYDLVLGQAARFGDFTGTDITKMKELADKFPTKPYLAFATLKDSFSDAEKKLLRGLVENEYKVIALTREELDPYDLFDRFENAPHKYGVGFKELSENTIHLNLR